jgi:CRP-like cAMP-binding protein
VEKVREKIPLPFLITLSPDVPPAVELHPARRKLVQEGRRCDELFVVHSGWLVAFRQLADGGRQIFNFWLPGEVCGVEFIACRTAPYCLATLMPCRLSRVSRERLDASSATGAALAALACRNSLILRERIVSLGRRSAFVRIVHLLLELTLRSRQLSGADWPLPLTQLEVADSTGLTVSYVNRILRLMRDRGQLEMSRDGLRLIDADGLMRVVGFSRAYLEEEVCLPPRVAPVAA